MTAVDRFAAFGFPVAAVVAMCVANAAAQAPLDLGALLAADRRLATVLEETRDHRVQVLVGEPVRAPDGRTTLRQSAYGDARQYFYPASTVKLGAAVTALLELQRLSAAGGGEAGANAPRAFGLDGEWTMHRLFASDATLAETPIPIRRDLRHMLVVSDNDAFNHCFELLGPQRLNAALWRAGFASARMWHRLSEPHSLAENRQARAVTLRGGGDVYELPARDDGPVAAAFDNHAFTDLDVGQAHLRDGKRIDAPMSFAQKNAITLADLQCMLAAVVRPDIDTGRRGFPELGVGARAFLVECLGMLPRESPDPVYDEKQYPDAYAKWALPGARRVVPAAHLRDYSKTGQAYGFTIENAYLEDARTGRGVFLAAVVYSNPNGVIGDDTYGYREVAEPFMVDVAEDVVRAVLGDERVRADGERAR